MRYDRAIFLFRRDLRLHDNKGLNAALECTREVIPLFIFDPRQVDAHPYRSLPALQFMLSSLDSLNGELIKCGSELYTILGDPSSVLATLAKRTKIQAVFWNKDYTPFSKSRDEALIRAAESSGLAVHQCEDSFLNDPGSVLKDDGTPYTVFTPYWKKATVNQIVKPSSLKRTGFFRGSLSDAEPLSLLAEKILPTQSKTLALAGGREEALGIVEQLSTLKDYKAVRDLPSVKGTSMLSAHLKFGTVSAREVHARLSDLFGPSHEITRQLYWRDFFTHIAHFFPHVFGHSFHKKYDRVEWWDDPENFDKWCAGKTGFPIVDAGMRQLNSTGYMHNRVRMVVASFLTKDLQIDWRLGERYFAQKLIDYDPALNNGNWQWAASTGCDAQPYFRIFNPWLQQERFDPECLYIKKWVPELEGLAPKKIHTLYGNPSGLLNYPAPIVKHDEQKRIAERRFADLASSSA